MDVKVEIATIDNFKDIQKLNFSLFDKEIKEFDPTLNLKWPYSKEGQEYFKDRITKKDGCAFVLKFDNKIIGSLIGGLIKVDNYRTLSSLAELENMFILEEYRSMGGGSKLYDAFLNWAKSKKVKRIKVIASSQNIQGLNFYRKQGFNDYDVTLEMDL